MAGETRRKLRARAGRALLVAVLVPSFACSASVPPPSSSSRAAPTPASITSTSIAPLDPADDPLPPSSPSERPSSTAPKPGGSGTWSETGEIPASEPSRRAALDALVSGSPSGTELVEEATDPGVPTDSRLVEKLAPVSYAEVKESRNPATVLITVAQVTGGLAKDDATFIARRDDGAYERCYREGLAQSPKLQGRAIIDVAIDAQGQVTSSKARAGFPRPGTASCLAQAVEDLEFPEAKGAARIVLQIDLVPR